MWYFKKLWLRWNEKNLPFKMEVWSNDLQADSATEISEQFAAIGRELSQYSTRLNLKDKKDIVHGYYTDIFGNRHKLPQPLFSQNEIAEMEKSNLSEKFFNILFIILEGIIFSQLISFLIPREVRREIWWISLPVGIILAVGVLYLIQNALRAHYTYLQAKILQKEYNYPDYKLEKIRKDNTYNLLIIAAVILFNITAGFMRERILLGSAADTNPFLGKVVLILSITMSVMLIFGMALSGRRKVEKSVKYAVFSNWKKNEKERKKYLDLLKQLHTSKAVEQIVQTSLDKHWQLMNDICRVFGEKYDRTRQPVYDQFMQETRTAAPGSRSRFRCLDLVDEDFYRKYQYIQSADYDLFCYGILRRGQLLASEAALQKQVEEQYELIISFEQTYKNMTDENIRTTALSSMD